MKSTVIFAILLFSLSGLLLPPVNAQSNPIMPDWFKNNAKWWGEGLISDSDMINALESLMIQDVIPLDRFVTSSGIEHTAGVLAGGTLTQIPDYQKNVFGYWSEGIVSDDEIINSIGYLMSTGIINSEKIQTEISERQEKYEKAFGVSGLDDATSKEYGIDSRPAATVCSDDNVCDSSKVETCSKQDGNISGKCIPTWFGIKHAWAPVSYQELFETAKQNEVSMSYLQKIKSGEYEIMRGACDKAVKDYAEKTNQDYMDVMNILCNAEKLAKEESLKLVEIYKNSIQLSENAKKSAINLGIPVLDLEKSVENQILELDSMSRSFKTPSEVKEAYNDAQKSQKMANLGLQKTILSVISDSLLFQELHITDQNFVSDEIRNLQYSDFKIITVPCDVHVDDSGDSCYENFGGNLELVAEESESFILGSVFSSSQFDVRMDDFELDPYGLREFSRDSNRMNIPLDTTFRDILHTDILEGYDLVDSDDGYLTEEQWEQLEPADPNPTPNPDDVYDLPGLDDDTEYVTPPTESTQTGNQMEELIQITALNFNDQTYPITQFTLWKWIGECDDAWHYHTGTGHAVNLELGGMGDPDPNNCGYGKVTNLPAQTTWMTQSTVDAFIELTGINPVGTDAQMGGSGP